MSFFLKRLLNGGTTSTTTGTTSPPSSRPALSGSNGNGSGSGSASASNSPAMRRGPGELPGASAPLLSSQTALSPSPSPSPSSSSFVRSAAAAATTTHAASPSPSLLRSSPSSLSLSTMTVSDAAGAVAGAGGGGASGTPDAATSTAASRAAAAEPASIRVHFLRHVQELMGQQAPVPKPDAPPTPAQQEAAAREAARQNLINLARIQRRMATDPDPAARIAYEMSPEGQEVALLRGGTAHDGATATAPGSGASSSYLSGLALGSSSAGTAGGGRASKHRTAASGGGGGGGDMHVTDPALEFLAPNTFVVPPDQRARVVWAKAMRVMANVQKLQRAAARDPRTASLVTALLEGYRIPFVLVRTQSGAPQTWMQSASRRLVYFPESGDVPLPLAPGGDGAASVFPFHVAEQEHAQFEVVYWNVCDMAALAVASTVRPSMPSVRAFGGVLPDVHDFDARPDWSVPKTPFEWPPPGASSRHGGGGGGGRRAGGGSGSTGGGSGGGTGGASRGRSGAHGAADEGQDVTRSTKMARKYLFRQFSDNRVRVFETRVLFDAKRFESDYAAQRAPHPTAANEWLQRASATNALPCLVASVSVQGIAPEALAVEVWLTGSGSLGITRGAYDEAMREILCDTEACTVRQTMRFGKIVQAALAPPAPVPASASLVPTAVSGRVTTAASNCRHTDDDDDPCNGGGGQLVETWCVDQRVRPEQHCCPHGGHGNLVPFRGGCGGSGSSNSDLRKGPQSGENGARLDGVRLFVPKKCDQCRRAALCTSLLAEWWHCPNDTCQSGSTAEDGSGRQRYTVCSDCCADWYAQCRLVTADGDLLSSDRPLRHPDPTIVTGDGHNRSGGGEVVVQPRRRRRFRRPHMHPLARISAEALGANDGLSTKYCPECEQTRPLTSAADWAGCSGCEYIACPSCARWQHCAQWQCGGTAPGASHTLVALEHPWVEPTRAAVQVPAGSDIAAAVAARERVESRCRRCHTRSLPGDLRKKCAGTWWKCPTCREAYLVCPTCIEMVSDEEQLSAANRPSARATAVTEKNVERDVAIQQPRSASGAKRSSATVSSSSPPPPPTPPPLPPVQKTSMGVDHGNGETNTLLDGARPVQEPQTERAAPDVAAATVEPEKGDAKSGVVHTKAKQTCPAAATTAISSSRTKRQCTIQGAHFMALQASGDKNAGLAQYQRIVKQRYGLPPLANTGIARHWNAANPGAKKRTHEEEEEEEEKEVAAKTGEAEAERVSSCAEPQKTQNRDVKVQSTVSPPPQQQQQPPHVETPMSPPEVPVECVYAIRRHSLQTSRSNGASAVAACSALVSDVPHVPRVWTPERAYRLWQTGRAFLAAATDAARRDRRHSTNEALERETRARLTHNNNDSDWDDETHGDVTTTLGFFPDYGLILRRLKPPPTSFLHADAATQTSTLSSPPPPPPVHRYVLVAFHRLTNACVRVVLPQLNMKDLRFCHASRIGALDVPVVHRAIREALRVLYRFVDESPAVRAPQRLHKPFGVTDPNVLHEHVRRSSSVAFDFTFAAYQRNMSATASPYEAASSSSSANPHTSLVELHNNLVSWFQGPSMAAATTAAAGDSRPLHANGVFSGGPAAGTSVPRKTTTTTTTTMPSSAAPSLPSFQEVMRSLKETEARAQHASAYIAELPVDTYRYSAAFFRLLVQRLASARSFPPSSSSPTAPNAKRRRRGSAARQPAATATTSAAGTRETDAAAASLDDDDDDEDMLRYGWELARCLVPAQEERVQALRNFLLHHYRMECDGSENGNRTGASNFRAFGADLVDRIDAWVAAIVDEAVVQNRPVEALRRWLPARKSVAKGCRVGAVVAQDAAPSCRLWQTMHADANHWQRESYDVNDDDMVAHSNALDDMYAERSDARTSVRRAAAQVMRNPSSGLTQHFREHVMPMAGDERSRIHELLPCMFTRSAHASAASSSSADSVVSERLVESTYRQWLFLLFPPSKTTERSIAPLFARGAAWAHARLAPSLMHDCARLMWARPPSVLPVALSARSSPPGAPASSSAVAATPPWTVLSPLVYHDTAHVRDPFWAMRNTSLRFGWNNLSNSNGPKESSASPSASGSGARPPKKSKGDATATAATIVDPASAACCAVTVAHLAARDTKVRRQFHQHMLLDKPATTSTVTAVAKAAKATESPAVASDPWQGPCEMYAPVDVLFAIACEPFLDGRNCDMDGPFVGGRLPLQVPGRFLDSVQKRVADNTHYQFAERVLSMWSGGNGSTYDETEEPETAACALAKLMRRPVVSVTDADFVAERLAESRIGETRTGGKERRVHRRDGGGVDDDEDANTGTNFGPGVENGGSTSAADRSVSPARKKHKSSPASAGGPVAASTTPLPPAAPRVPCVIDVAPAAVQGMGGGGADDASLTCDDADDTMDDATNDRRAATVAATTMLPRLCGVSPTRVPSGSTGGGVTALKDSPTGGPSALSSSSLTTRGRSNMNKLAEFSRRLLNELLVPANRCAATAPHRPLPPNMATSTVVGGGGGATTAAGECRLSPAHGRWSYHRDLSGHGWTWLSVVPASTIAALSSLPPPTVALAPGVTTTGAAGNRKTSSGGLHGTAAAKTARPAPSSNYSSSATTSSATTKAARSSSSTTRSVNALVKEITSGGGGGGGISAAHVTDVSFVVYREAAQTLQNQMHYVLQCLQRVFWKRRPVLHRELGSRHVFSNLFDYGVNAALTYQLEHGLADRSGQQWTFAWRAWQCALLARHQVGRGDNFDGASATVVPSPLRTVAMAEKPFALQRTRSPPAALPVVPVAAADHLFPQPTTTLASAPVTTEAATSGGCPDEHPLVSAAGNNKGSNNDRDRDDNDDNDSHRHPHEDGEGSECDNDATARSMELADSRCVVHEVS